MHELPPRKQVILRAVILEYVAEAEPVASEALTQKYDLGVKSATVRNELAEMADLGFLEQPHTSAGRIPSDKGYRYYIDHLFIDRGAGPDAKQRVKGAAQEGEALQLLLQETTRALSRATHLLSAATVLKGGQFTVKTVVVSAFGPHQALVVLGLSNGDVENRIIDCPQNLTLADVGAINELLQRELIGKTLRSIQRLKAPAQSGPATAEALLSVAWSTIRTMAREYTRGNLVTEGEEFLFGQPEFIRDAAALSGLLDQLKESEVLYDSLSSTSDALGPVTIGRENRSPSMHQLSVVRHTFFVGPDEAGSIAVVGPTRMNYDATIPLVRFTAKALSEALTRYTM